MLSNESRHPCNLVVGDSENPKMQNTKRISFEAQYICRLRRLGVLGMVIILFAFPPPSASVIAFQPVGRSRGHKRIFEKSISKARYITILKSQDDSRKQDTATSSVDNLKTLLLPSSSCNPDQMSGTELAYIGDVVFELFIRSRHVWPSKRTQDLQNTVVAIVRAEHQANLLEQLKSSFPLTDKEKQILSRGRNAVTKSKNRRNPAAYQDSTAFEAYIGYLYISDQSRCAEVFKWLDEKVDMVES